MDIQIKKIEQTTFTYSDVVNLLHDVFADRVKNGMCFSAATISVEDYKNEAKEGEVYVAYDEESNSLMGTAMVKFQTRKGKKIAYYAHLAVSMNVQRQGIASRLFNIREKSAIDHDCDYIRSNTAEGAISSIKYHLKNGFKKVEFNSFAGTNYYSIIFRKQLKPSFFWNNSFLIACRYSIIYAAVKVLRKPNGSKTTIGKLLHL